MAHSKDKIEEMRFTIVISKDARSLASWKIYEALQRQMQSSGRGAGSEGQNIKFHISDKEIIYVDVSKQEKGTDFFIFASTHRSEQHNKTLTVHPIGNWNKADLGGKEKTLCTSSALIQKIAFLKLCELAKDTNYEVTLECTHHGPFLEKPCMFIEIGSSLGQWKDKNAAQIIAKTIQHLLKDNHQIKKQEIAIGLGGPHYSNTFNKILLRTNIATSHICPKHMLPYLTEKILIEAIEKTQEKVDFILLDWKGLGTEKTRIINLLKELDLDYKKSKDLLE